MDFFKFLRAAERREKTTSAVLSLCNTLTLINIIFTFVLFGQSVVFPLHTNNSEMKQLVNNAVLLRLLIFVALVTYLNMHVANGFTQLGDNRPSLHPTSDDLHCDHNDALKTSAVLPQVPQ